MKFSRLTIVAPALAEQPRDVGAGEAAAEDERAAPRARRRLYHRAVIQISVIGSGSEHEARAEEVGRLLAERGCTVVTGASAR